MNLQVPYIHPKVDPLYQQVLWMAMEGLRIKGSGVLYITLRVAGIFFLRTREPLAGLLRITWRCGLSAERAAV